MSVEGWDRDDDENLDDRLTFLGRLFDGVEDRPNYGGPDGISEHPDLPQLPMRRLTGSFEGVTGRAGRDPIRHTFPTGQEAQ